MKKALATLLLLSPLASAPLGAQPPLYMPKAKAIQAEARDMRDASRSSPQDLPDFTAPEGGEGLPQVQAKKAAKARKSPAPASLGAPVEPEEPALVQGDEVHKAASQGLLNELQLLEKRGYSLTRPDNELNTPLHLAAYRNQKEIVTYLLTRPGLLKDPCDKRGVTPLMLAAGAGNVEIVDALILAGCNFKLKDQDGATPLHRAAAQGQLACLERLIEAGADPLSPDRKGQTPLQVAQAKKKGQWESVVVRLRQLQVDPT